MTGGSQKDAASEKKIFLLNLSTYHFTILSQCLISPKLLLLANAKDTETLWIKTRLLSLTPPPTTSKVIF